MRSRLFVSITAGLALAATEAAADPAQLDPSDRAAIEEAAQDALEYGRTNEPGVWVNPVTGNQGIFTPIATRFGPNGEPCRQYTLWGNIDGDEQEVTGVACRRPDGLWLEAGPASARPASLPARNAVYTQAPSYPYQTRPFNVWLGYSGPGYHGNGYYSYRRQPFGGRPPWGHGRYRY